MPTPVSVSYVKLNVEEEAMVHWTRKKALRHGVELCLPWNNTGSRQGRNANVERRGMEQDPPRSSRWAPYRPWGKYTAPKEYVRFLA